ncbi:MAG: TatD family hydrolase [Nesterenkonia sp.]
MSNHDSLTPGQTPQAYIPTATHTEHDDAPVRSQTEEKSKRQRRLEYPPAPEPLPVPVLDNHAHLDFRDGMVRVTVEQHLDAAQQVGVAGAVLVGYDLASSEFSVEAAHGEPRAKAAVALHPNDAPQLMQEGKYDDAFSRIADLAQDPQVVAVGETGLDYFRTGEGGRDHQVRSFRDHIELAAQTSKTMQIHDREAHDDIVWVLKDAPALPERVVFHCFSGDAELARICNANGWFMSFAGTVTFKNAEPLREALAVADPQLILVETDCPFLTPHPYRGQPNAPYMIPQTMRTMAEVRGSDLAQLCQQVMFNTAQAYGSWT